MVISQIIILRIVRHVVKFDIYRRESRVSNFFTFLLYWLNLYGFNSCWDNFIQEALKVL
jgi:hypothetical protein